MKKYQIALTTLSALLSTETIAEEYCTKEVIEKTPAVLQSHCVIDEVTKMPDGNCRIKARKCVIPIFNAKTNAVENHDDLSFEGTQIFKDDESLKSLHTYVDYPDLTTSITLATSAAPGTSGDYCNRKTLENSPAVKVNKCEVVGANKQSKDTCFVVFQNCSVNVFNKETQEMVENVVPVQIHGEFPLNSRLEEIRAKVLYNKDGTFKVLYGLRVTPK
jgi:hypothetical protein